MTTYDWTVTIDGVNVSALVIGGGTIDYGRASRASGFQAPVAQFDLFTQTTYPNYTGSWPTVNLGDPVVIHVTWDGITQWRRFTGVVQALDWNPGGLRVTAAGTSTDWQNLSADGLQYTMSPYAIPVPDETETTRVDRLCDDAGVSITIEGVPARRVRGIPAGELPQPLLDALLRIADDCDALLMEDRLGVVHYRTRNFDRPASYTLPAAVVERDSLDLAYERGTHINAVRVFYGEPDATTGQQNYVYANDSATYNTVAGGERLAELYTDIQYSAGATGKANVYLEKNRLEWEIPDVTLLMNQATGVQADAILDLQENFMVTVDDLPTGCPIASYDGDILGFTDIMSEQDYRIVLHLGPRIADTGATPEVPIFPEDSMTGGTESLEEDANGYLWQIHAFTTPGTSSITVNNDVTPEVLVVGAGGSGGPYNFARAAGGGGAGALFYEELAYTPGTISVTVGAGAAGAVGGTSKAGDVWAYGGGVGSYGSTGGGSGGGQAFGDGGVGTATYGSVDGGVTTASTRFRASNGNLTSGGRAGSGGGAASGAGVSLNITGTALTYAAGGLGGAQQGSPNTGAAGTDGTGSGGEGCWPDGASTPGRGGHGAVIFRYRIG